ncbi:aldo-keto reductase [Cylindrobasidium torrendii FP15055 ss-10]|uniref:Aldo-keto reductase n=1 Tax=Cylindrobasidium torrendii FP15055 ss-10 TaxID=1314674 RepID=A0A0D7B3E0_9AGAR|nr:aldo-keto reductase [Cylindrobasidium torrendii FP15055 ss-10]
MSLTSLDAKVKLRDGKEIPQLGFGTYELDGKDAYNAVTIALEAGYRHIDSAEWYDNEKEVGQAIRDFLKRSGLPRSDVFYTTKLKNNVSHEATLASIKKSLDLCGLEYLDLYLIHGPWGGRTIRRACWRALCEARDQGLIRTAGVSTFGLRHLKEIIEGAGGTDGTDSEPLEVPVVHQIDLHPFQTRTAIVEYCKEQGITLEAWAPLVRGMRFNHPVVKALSEKYSKAPAQILLRYSLQKGFVAIPKSSSKTRIYDNTNLFDFAINDEEMKELDALDEGLVTDWDPTNCP